MEPSCLQDLCKIRKILKRRAELLAKKDVPKQSELYSSLGKTLGNVVMNNMPLISKELMGATDPLKGPSDNLWIPPESRISKKICLVPPSPIDITKAFTHQGILEIGEEMESKIENKCLKRIQKATAESSEFERFECKRRLKFAIHCQEKKHLQDIKNLQQDCEELLRSQTYALHEEYIQGRTEYIAKYRCDCQKNCVTTQTVETQTDDSIKEKIDTEIHTEHAKKIEQMNNVTKCLWEDFKEHLRIQRHVMTCTKITELLHVICAQKLDANQKIEKIKKECSNELNKIAGNNGYNKIKDKYLALMKNLKQFVQLASKDMPENLEFLAEFQRIIDKNMLEIEFEENQCRCCTDAQKNLRTRPSNHMESRSPAGIIIFSKQAGAETFCTCQSSSDDELIEEFKNQLTGNLLTGEIIDAEWTTASETRETASSNCDMEPTKNLSMNSDRHIATKIATLINIEDILKKAFERIVLSEDGCLAIEVLQDKLYDYVVHEFHARFNKDVIIGAIGHITSERRQSLLAATDSLELIKARRSIKTE